MNTDLKVDFENRGLNAQMKAMGFLIVKPYQLFTYDLSRYTALVVEGSRVKGFAEYRYTFYKTKYLPDGRMLSLNVYIENESIRRVLPRVASFLSFLEKNKWIKQKEGENIASKGK